LYAKGFFSTRPPVLPSIALEPPLGGAAVDDKFLYMTDFYGLVYRLSKER
jgi:hypothetical protein